MPHGLLKPQPSGSCPITSLSHHVAKSNGSFSVLILLELPAGSELLRTPCLMTLPLLLRHQPLPSGPLAAPPVSHKLLKWCSPGDLRPISGVPTNTPCSQQEFAPCHEGTRNVTFLYKMDENLTELLSLSGKHSSSCSSPGCYALRGATPCSQAGCSIGGLHGTPSHDFTGAGNSSQICSSLYP